MNHRTAPPGRARLSRALPFMVSGFLALATVPGSAVKAAADYPSPDVAAPLTTDQLDQLVAPIALYPDELVAEVLAAATYPTDVVEADRWMQTNAQLQGDALANAVNAQPWASSVKALAQFPSVLAMMDKNLSWTTSLGGAYMRDSQSLMNAVQEMRARAEQAGNLKSTPQETVTNDGQTIDVEPADPAVIYVPEYDPWLCYGAPVLFYPDWTPIAGLYLDEPGIYFGFGIGIGLFGDYGWGWNHWRPDWRGHGVYFNHQPYVAHDLTFDQHRPVTFNHGAGFARSSGFNGGLARNAGVSGGLARGAGFSGGVRSGAFASRGGAGSGGFHGASAGGFHGGGGFGGSHGGGGGRR
ncbi:MAG: DUF3300 domain-containing protein [Steroidobacteraceae bacterium]